MASAIETIVAGIATLHDADPVLQPAVELARSLGARLHLVHAFDLPDPWLAEAVAREGVHDDDFSRRYSESLQSRLESLTREAAGDEPSVSCEAAVGAASSVLCSAVGSHGAQLLMVGATRRGTMSRNILGTTAERVIRTAQVPVLVLREPLRRPLRRVLLATDLSEFSARVHECALDTLDQLFHDEEPEFRALMVVPQEVALPPPVEHEALAQVAHEELADFLAARQTRDLAIEPRVRVGDPAKEIVAEAYDWDAGLLVMGTHGRTGFSRMVLGSVAGSAVRGALCNMLVVPGAALPAGTPARDTAAAPAANRARGAAAAR